MAFKRSGVRIPLPPPLETKTERSSDKGLPEMEALFSYLDTAATSHVNDKVKNAPASPSGTSLKSEGRAGALL